MTRKMRSCAFSLLLLAMSTAGAFAQNVATAELQGVVTDPNGAVVSGATVTARDEARNISRSAVTNDQGEYRILNIPPGTYAVSAEKEGFGKLVAPNVNLTVGKAARLPLTLGLATVETAVTVTDQVETIETATTAVSTTIPQVRIDNLPINGRNYINFTLTNSQATRDTAPSIGVAPTSGINIGGQRARSNLVNVDGMDNVDNSVNGIRSTVSQEAVQEFQVITNGYAPEFGRASGGVVNIITRSGTNAFHGNLFAYFRHKSFQADNPFTTVADPPYTRVQTGVTVGGPIRRDKTFFFFSYETTRRQETGFSSIGQNNFGLVDTDISRFFGAPAGSVVVLGTPQQKAVLENPATPVNAGTAQYAAIVGRSSGMALDGQWPAALGGLRGFVSSCLAPGCFVPGSFVALNSLVGNYPISEGTSLWGLRLDHSINPNQNLLVRANVSPSTVTGLNVNAQNQPFGQNAFSRTSEQSFRDIAVTAQHSWAIGATRVNEFRFQFSRRGLLYTGSTMADTAGDTNTEGDGTQVAVNIPGFAFFGREPFSFADRSEKRWQMTDNFSWVKGSHQFKFGGDVNIIPVDAVFEVNFGGIFNFGTQAIAAGLPALSPVQMYGFGIPEVFIQQVGDPRAVFTNKTLGLFVQDSWRIRPNFTMNYGVRWDYEHTPIFDPLNALAGAAQQELGITQGIPRDKNNFAPRIGFAWDPWGDNKTVLRGSYGLFYDHPLLGLVFLSQVADGTQAPGIAFFGAAPAAGCNLTATAVYQGILACPASFGFLPNEQRFDAANASVFVEQNFLTAGVPLGFLPFGFPVGDDFEYAYSQQGSFGIEHDLGNRYSVSLSYNFNGGRHLNRSINVNPVNSEAVVVNWERAMRMAQVLGVAPNNAAFPRDPRTFGTNPATFATLPPCGISAAGSPLGAYVAPAVMNFFRRSGANPSLTPVFTNPLVVGAPLAALCTAAIAQLTTEFGLGPGIVPFSDMSTNLSNGSSVYHGLTVNMKKDFSKNFEFLASYTWSHAIDDSTDLQSLLSPQDNRRPDLERANSSFDQRHRFVWSSVFQSGKRAGDGFGAKFLSDWTIAPIIEISSGRPFNILVGADRNFDFGSNTDRPNAVPLGTPANFCGNAGVASPYSPLGAFQPACHIDSDAAAALAGLGAPDGIAGVPLTGNMPRNPGTRPYTVFTDLRVARRFHFNERWSLDAVADVFNLLNRFNTADVNVLWENAGQTTSAFDPRQFQFALKLNF